jgi:PAS domain S-box-containing protein
MKISEFDLKKINGFLNACPVTVYVIDSDRVSQPLLISENVKNVLGYEPKDITGTTNFWVKHIHPDDRKRFCSEFKESLRTGHFCSTYRISKKNGGYCWVLDRALPARNSNQRT